MDRSGQAGPSRKPPAVWLPWVMLFLTAGWGGAALFGQIPKAPETNPAPTAVPGNSAAERERILRELQPGISEDRVRELLGRPNHLARQVLHLRYLEQWVYDSPFPVRLEIECPRGRKPHLLTVQLLTSGKP
jgi:hypothetical protein